MKKISLSFIFLSLGLIMISCEQVPLLDTKKAIPGENWERFNTLWFEYENQDTEQFGDIALHIHYRDDVELDRLEIMGSIHAPSGEMRYKEYMIHFRDADGNMKGEKVQDEGGDTPVYTQEIKLRQGFQFREAGQYRFEIENLSSKYDNPGIVSVGLKVLPVTESEDV